ncbi:MAG TPA: OmpA family protein [Chitinophaga sp.]|uniref:OmpA family protein n=1 Tax=Chitinophaga sp. TaxID=1869181 RepID=UPI002DB7A9FC|nr:OmpA family protein [Chitinophaga sp.]HEU4553948.1 OmpA family protein [Chitinophaga sp.]
MASKKYLLLAGAMSLLAASTGFAQVQPNYDALDSSKVPASRAAQQNNFVNHQYDYPAKPRSMWELGFHGGYHFIRGDMDARPGFGGGLSLRKALGHTFSVRAEYTGSFDKGLDFQKRPIAGGVNGPWAATNAANGYIVPNYKTATHQVSLDMIASLSNILFYKSQPKVNWYVFGGYSLLLVDVDVDALDASGNPYSYAGIDFNGKRKDIKDALKNLYDGDYEQNAPSQGNRAQIGRKDNNQMWRHAIDFGTGIAFKVSKRFNIGVEEKLTMPFDDYLDGYNSGAYDASKDFFSYTSVRLNFNLGNPNKRVEPLWWINPLDYAYNELSSPRHMKLPTPVLPDADGDGVTDQFDREPNTPAGAPVDVHGVSKDTDGDGVPDFKDKQLITPTYCQPVDADGVGKCPDPECCKNMTKVSCSGIVLPSVSFKGSSTKISSDNEAILSSVANTLRTAPECNVLVTGHAGAKGKKGGVDLSSRRVDAVIDYLADKQGIDRGRFIKQNTPGESSTVDLAPAN